MAKAKFTVETCRGDRDHWWWRVRAANGQIVLTSELYASRQKRDGSAGSFCKATGLVVTDDVGA